MIRTYIGAPTGVAALIVALGASGILYAQTRYRTGAMMGMRSIVRARATWLALVAILALPTVAAAQERRSDRLSALVAEARATNPEIQASRRAVESAAARIPQAGAPPDPMLMFGAMWLPSNFNLSDPADAMMALFPIRLTQRIPVPGSLGIRESMAREAHAAVVEQAAETELAVLTRLRSAYYEAYFVESALEVLDRNRALLVDFAGVARVRFAVGRVPQQDVLRAQTEVSRLDEQKAALRARLAAALAEVNAILQRPPTEPVRPTYPDALRRLAMAAPAAGVFTAAALDGGLADGFPSLAELQEAAVRERPLLQAQSHRVRAARDGVRLAERQRWPDFGVILEYAPRPAGHRSLVTAMVTVDLPIFAGRKQRQRVVEAEHEHSEQEMRYRDMVNEIRAEVARRYAAVVRTREQILLLADGVIPQARATLESATAAYQAGRVEFAGLMDAQAAVFRHEIELARQFADFGRELAALERAVGLELDWE